MTSKWLIMRILMLGDWGPGGILNHTKCLLKELRACSDVEIYCIGEDEPYVGGKHQGHDVRKLFQLRRVIKRFKPDVVHVQKFCIVNFIYLKFFTRIPRIVSLHMPYGGLRGWKGRALKWMMSPCYFIPVSSPTWDGFKSLYPDSKGEVFFNPISMAGIDVNVVRKATEWRNGEAPVVGMVGRNADQKDWPKFSACMQSLLRLNPLVKCWGVGVDEKAAEALGEAGECVEWKGPQKNGKEWIGKMDVFVITSKYEQLPTTVLECFAMQTPICGFIPDGGMTDILALSSGPLREVFLKERDSEKLAGVINRVLSDGELRKRLIEDGWQIVTKHFAAEKTVPEQLVPIYKKICGHD